MFLHVSTFFMIMRKAVNIFAVSWAGFKEKNLRFIFRDFPIFIPIFLDFSVVEVESRKFKKILN